MDGAKYTMKDALSAFMVAKIVAMIRKFSARMQLDLDH